jgi:hypothetical protein
MPEKTTERRDRRGCPPGAGTAQGVPGTRHYAGKIGNPPFVATDEQRQNVRLYAKVMSHEMIAASFEPPISIDTLKRHFRKELDDGKREAVAAVGGKLLAKAMGGNMTAMIFYLRTQGKWNTRVELSGPDGGPIQHLDLSPILANFSDEQLALIEPILEQLLTAAGIDLDGGDPLDSPAD